MRATPRMTAGPARRIFAGLIFVLLAMGAVAARADIAPFVGDFSGSAEMVSADGTSTPRDMSVTISKTRDGFRVGWTTITYKSDGRTKVSPFSVDFLPTDRPGIYSAAMQRNVFGHAVPLDPMRGEPYVWGRITGDTLTVYSLFVDDKGGYEMQQYDRTLAEGGLMLEFSRLRNGEMLRSVSAFLKRQ
ncbi:MAG: hypothetical protein ACK5MY_06180 [Jhaorihella sp.]